jgi:hypothetical protein
LAHWQLDFADGSTSGHKEHCPERQFRPDLGFQDPTPLEQHAARFNNSRYRLLLVIAWSAACA